MAKKKTKRQNRFIYRACFRPDQLDLLKDLDTGLDGSGRGLGYAQAWHRANSRYSPYCVANEYICAKLGTVVGLPIPPFAITHGSDGQVFFSSLDFNYARAKLPCIVASECVASIPWLCAGVLIFDVWIANEDRHDQNLLTDTVSRPSHLHVYDHDQALFGGCLVRGAERLQKLRNHIGINGDATVGGYRHVFLEEIQDASLFHEWYERISGVPNYVIKDACDFAYREIGITVEEKNEASEFLIYRRNQIENIVNNHRSDFSAVKHWPEGFGF